MTSSGDRHTSSYMLGLCSKRVYLMLFLFLGTLFALSFYNRLDSWIQKPALPIDNLIKEEVQVRTENPDTKKLYETTERSTVEHRKDYQSKGTARAAEVDEEVLSTQQVDSPSSNNDPSNSTASTEDSNQKPIEYENLSSGTRQGYLVYSESCKIPDVDPYHRTIRKLISTTPPLDCGLNFPPLSYTQNRKLFINQSHLEYWARRNNVTGNYSELQLGCCYRELRRAGDGQSDNLVNVSGGWTEVSDGDEIPVEFIKLRCSLKGSQIYVNYHGFVHDKPATEARCTEEGPRNDSRRYSVLIMGLDGMSRLNMHRQIKKTVKYMKEVLGAIEMKGFNKVGDNTFPNLIPLMTGYSEQELRHVCRKSDAAEMDNCTMLWSRFGALGYRTFYAEDTPHISSYNYIKKGFLRQPTDYYLRPLILTLEDVLGFNKKLNCHLCAGSLSEAQIVLEYTAKFVANFGNRSSFGMSWINSMSHDYLNSASSGDQFFYDFFQSQYSNLENTFVILMGDHGQRWGPIRATHIGRLEERLPMLLIVPPRDFSGRYPQLYQNLVLNSQRLVTPYDLYATLENLLDFRGMAAQRVDTSTVPESMADAYSDRAHSLFSNVPADRGCEDAAIAEEWCTCHASGPAPLQDEEVQHASQYAVAHLNNLLRENKDCARLRLSKISRATVRTPAVALQGKSESNIHDYTVTFETTPGDSEFEATVRYVPYKHEHALLGTVSRLNLYGNQSFCVTGNALLKKYCYCL